MAQRRPAHGNPPKGEKVRWIARYYDDAGNERGKNFPTKKAAEQYERDQKTAVDRGTWVDPNDMATPLIDIAREWHAEATRDNTKANRQALLDNLGDLGRTPVGRIKASNITAWRNVLLEGRPWRDGRPLSESTVGNMVGQVCGLLKRAHNDGMIGRVPVVKVPKAAPERSVSRQDLMTVEDVAALIAATRDGRRAPLKKNGKRMTATRDSPPRPQIARMLEVAAGSGLRVSELCGLRVCDVDTMRQTISVNGQVKLGGEEWVPVPKSEKSRRVIPVPQFVIDSIVLQLREHPQSDRQGPIFPYHGDVATRVWHCRNDMGKYLVKVCRAHGLRSVSMHDLRHFYASALIAGGATVPEVQDALGHAKPSTTLNTYTHLWPRADEKLREAAGATMELVRAKCGQVA